MFSVRKNFYNNDILMIHREKLLPQRGRTKLIESQISNLLKLYDRSIFDLPYELVSWPNQYIGLSLIDERNHEIVKCLLQERNNDLVPFYRVINEAVGKAFLEDNYELANELKRLNAAITESYPFLRDVLQYISEETLDYLLALIQTDCELDKDQEIIYYDGESFILANTKYKPPIKILK